MFTKTVLDEWRDTFKRAKGYLLGLTDEQMSSIISPELSEGENIEALDHAHHKEQIEARLSAAA